MKTVIFFAALIILSGCAKRPEQPKTYDIDIDFITIGNEHYIGYQEKAIFVGKDSLQNLVVFGDSLKAINILWNQLEKSNAATKKVWHYYHVLLRSYEKLKKESR